MNMDTELETWRREWQSEGGVPADLRQRVERQSRWLKIGLAADLLVTVAIGGVVIALATRSPEPDMLFLAAATWTFIAAAWAFRLTNTRGLWSPAAITSAAFVNLSIQRCRAQLKATLFGAVLYVCEMLFCLGWIYRHNMPREALGTWLLCSPTVRVVCIVSVAFFVGLVLYRRKKHAELVWLDTLQSSENHT